MHRFKRLNILRKNVIVHVLYANYLQVFFDQKIKKKRLFYLLIYVSYIFIYIYTYIIVYALRYVMYHI